MNFPTCYSHMLKEWRRFEISNCYKLISIPHEHPLNRGASALYINYKLAINNNSYGDTFLSLYWLVYINYNQWSPNTQFAKSNFYVTDFPFVKKKVGCTLVQALRLCTGRTAHRGSRSIALLFHDQRH